MRDRERSRQLKVLAFAGSLRRGSLNKKLLKNAIVGAREAGASVTLIDLEQFPMPIYNGDLEEESGLPKEAHDLKELFLSHDALLIASPEYNSSVSAAVKNAIDWISRPVQGEESLIAFRNKTGCLLSASPGNFGGMRGLIHLRSILSNIGVMLLPQQMVLPKAHEAFDNEDNLIDSAKRRQAVELGALLVDVATKLERNSEMEFSG